MYKTRTMTNAKNAKEEVSYTAAETVIVYGTNIVTLNYLIT